jgi:hypothetical protein
MERQQVINAKALTARAAWATAFADDPTGVLLRERGQTPRQDGGAILRRRSLRPRYTV